MAATLDTAPPLFRRTECTEPTPLVPAPHSFLERLRSDRDKRYPLTNDQASFENRFVRIGWCFIPGSELLELLIARADFQRARAAHDEVGMEAARIDAVWVCLSLGISGVLPGGAEMLEEVYELSGGKVVTGSNTVGLLRASLSGKLDTRDPFVAIARRCLTVPGARAILDRILG